MDTLPVDRALSIYGALADRFEMKGARERLSRHLMQLYIDGEKNQHRLTVHGLSYLRELDRRTRPPELKPNGFHPFCACRCIRSELRRVIRAFALRTASVLLEFASVDEAIGKAAIGHGRQHRRRHRRAAIDRLHRHWTSMSGCAFFHSGQTHTMRNWFLCHGSASQRSPFMATLAIKGSITSGEYAVSSDATYAPVAACFTGERA